MQTAALVGAAIAAVGAVLTLVALPARARRGAAGARVSSGAAETATDRRPPGRPRSERSHLAIVRATLELLAEVGYQRLTMEQVQRRAGVGKATIYRRWDSKAELVKDAIQYFSAELPVPDTGSLPGTTRRSRPAVVAIAADRNAALLMPRLLAEASGDQELHAIFYAQLVEPRRRVAADRARAGARPRRAARRRRHRARRSTCSSGR